MAKLLVPCTDRFRSSKLKEYITEVWNVRKRRLGGSVESREEAWLYILHETRRRERQQNRASQVWIDDELVPPKEMAYITTRLIDAMPDPQVFDQCRIWYQLLDAT